jgi:hypothetical protein
MKARITTMFATAVVALAFAASALAAPHQGTIRGWSHSPSGAKTWTIKPWTIKPWSTGRDYTRPGTIKGWALTPNPWGSRGQIAPNPSSIRLVKPNPTCIRGSAQAVKGW